MRSLGKKRARPRSQIPYITIGVHAHLEINPTFRVNREECLLTEEEGGEMRTMTVRELVDQSYVLDDYPSHDKVVINQVVLKKAYSCGMQPDCHNKVLYSVNGNMSCKDHMLEEVAKGEAPTILPQAEGEEIPLEMDKPVPTEFLPPEPPGRQTDLG